MHVSLLGYGEMFTSFNEVHSSLVISLQSYFSIYDHLYENLCFVTVCYFVHYTWDCWCSFKVRWLQTLLGYSTMFIFALLGILQCLIAP